MITANKRGGVSIIYALPQSTIKNRLGLNFLITLDTIRSLNESGSDDVYEKVLLEDVIDMFDMTDLSLCEDATSLVATGKSGSAESNDGDEDDNAPKDSSEKKRGSKITVDAIKQKLKRIIDTIIGFCRNIVNKISELFKKIINKIIDKHREFVENAADKHGKYVGVDATVNSGIPNNPQQLVSAIWSIIMKKAGKMASANALKNNPLEPDDALAYISDIKNGNANKIVIKAWCFAYNNYAKVNLSKDAGRTELIGLTLLKKHENHDGFKTNAFSYKIKELTIADMGKIAKRVVDAAKPIDAVCKGAYNMAISSLMETQKSFDAVFRPYQNSEKNGESVDPLITQVINAKLACVKSLVTNTAYVFSALASDAKLMSQLILKYMNAARAKINAVEGKEGDELRAKTKSEYRQAVYEG